MAEEIKGLIIEQGRAFEEFKRKNDELLKAKAEGKAVGDLTADVAKLNEAITQLSTDMREVEKKSRRPNVGASEEKNEASAARTKAFGKLLRKGAYAMSPDEVKAMGSFSDPDGGFLIPEEIDTAIDRIAPTISAMNRLANVVTIGASSYAKLVKTSGMAMRRIAEGAAGGETTEPKYAKIEIEVFTAEVEPWVYNETLEDAFINLEADLTSEAAIGFAEGSGAEFITGNGVGKARGIASYPTVANSAYSWGSLGYIPSGASGAFAPTNPVDAVVSLQHALKAQYRPGAAWLCNDTTLGVMRQMKDGSGTFYLWNPDPAGAFGGRFLGNPVEVDDNVADIGAGSLSLAFGNFPRAYTIVNRAGTTLIRDNITSKGTTKFNFRRRFGGGVVNFEAIKWLKFAAA